MFQKNEELYAGEICNSGPITYSVHISRIISNNCLVCHQAKDKSGEIVMENFDQVVDAAGAGKLLSVITHTDGFPAMPKDAAQLPGCDIDAVRKWINEGMAN